MDVRRETLGPFDLITSVSLGAYPTSAPKAWDQLFTWLKKQSDITPKQLIGFGMDNPAITPAHLTRYVAATTYEGKFNEDPENNIYPMSIKAGNYAITTMKGPYTQMPETFAKFTCEWLPSSGETLDISRPFLEIYLNDPFEVPEEEYLTDLHLPLQ